MRYSLNAVALAAFSTYALAKEMVPNEKLAAEIYDNGLRHQTIMATKEVRTAFRKHVEFRTSRANT